MPLLYNIKMNPDIWGKHAWIFLHSVTFNYPDNPSEEHKEAIYDMLMSLRYILPCLTCQLNFRNHIKKHPLSDKVLSCKENLVKWMIDVHNIVNEQNGKSKQSYNDVIDYYKKLYGGDVINSNILNKKQDKITNKYSKNSITKKILSIQTFMIIILMFLLALIIYIKYKSNKN
jgi:hypothetical protein